MTSSSRPCAVKPLRLCAEVRLYGRQFSKAHPNAGGKTPLQSLNSNRLKVVTSYVEPSLAKAQLGQKFQFERQGCLFADSLDHQLDKRVVNLALGLKDSLNKS